MTEEEWLSLEDTLPLWKFLQDNLSKRKLRLFGCGACRHLWEWIDDSREQQAVETAERYADGLATEAELQAAHKQAGRAIAKITEARPGEAVTYFDPAWAATKAAWMAVGKQAAYAVQPFDPISESVERHLAWDQGWKKELAYLWQLLNDLVGPAEPATVAFDPRWRSADAVGVARGIYEDRAFDRLPLLADALMDAGCDDEQVLGHCRGDGPHVRGCWVVDLVLGKE